MSSSAPFSLARHIAENTPEPDRGWVTHRRRHRAANALAAQTRALPPDHNDLVEMIGGIKIYEPEASRAEVNRARAMLAAHNISVQKVRDVMAVLTIGHNTATRAPTSAERRVALAALVGVVIGYESISAQRLVDQARDKPVGEVVAFVARQAAAIGIMGGSAVGGLLIAQRGLNHAATASVRTMVGAESAALGAGGMVTGMGIAAAGALLAVGGVAYGYEMLGATRRANPNLTEETFKKDVRIFRGLQEGALHLPNHPPVEAVG